METSPLWLEARGPTGADRGICWFGMSRNPPRHERSDHALEIGAPSKSRESSKSGAAMTWNCQYPRLPASRAAGVQPVPPNRFASRDGCPAPPTSAPAPVSQPAMIDNSTATSHGKPYRAGTGPYSRRTIRTLVGQVKPGWRVVSTISKPSA